jgi:hypothetical protein
MRYYSEIGNYGTTSLILKTTIMENSIVRKIAFIQTNLMIGTVEFSFTFQTLEGSVIASELHITDHMK